MHGIQDRKIGEFITFDSTEEDDRSSLNPDEGKQESKCDSAQ
jgi:hypothetical protein